jgi:hypothetical protein
MENHNIRKPRDLAHRGASAEWRSQKEISLFPLNSLSLSRSDALATVLLTYENLNLMIIIIILTEI